jgi:hypothetical protein
MLVRMRVNAVLMAENGLPSSGRSLLETSVN